MKIKILLRPVNSHAHFNVFVNGALAGSLCFNEQEWKQLIQEKHLDIDMNDKIIQKRVDSYEDLCSDLLEDNFENHRTEDDIE